MARIRKAYNDLTGHRDAYLQDAQFNERYTVMVGNTTDGQTYEHIRLNLFDTIGVTITRALASTSISVLYPINVYFFKYALNLGGGSQPTEAQRRQLVTGERVSMQAFDRMMSKSALYFAHLHSLIAGNALLHFFKSDDEKKGPSRVRFFPLSWFVVEREGSWIRRIILRQPMKRNTEEEKKSGRYLYTEIDFVGNTVKEELDGSEESKADDFDGDLVEGDEPARWVVVTDEMPRPGEHYAPAYVNYYISKIMSSNVLERGFQLLINDLSKIIKAVRPGSGLNPHEMQRLASGAWIEAEEGDIIYPQLDARIGSALQWILEKLTRNNNELKTEFLFGLLNREPAPETATLVRQLVAELNNLGAQFYAHHQDHTQLAIAKALQSVTGFKVTEDVGDDEPIQPEILTGQSALSRQETADTMLQVIERLGKLDPEWVSQLPMNAIYQRVADSFQLETDDLVNPEAGFVDLIRQLMGALRENPQQNLAIIIQVLQQAVGPEQLQQLVQLAANPNQATPQTTGAAAA